MICHLKDQSLKGPPRAVKTIKRSSTETDQTFLQEMDMLSKVPHPNIIKVFEMYSSDRSYHVVTEYFKGQILLNRINEQQLF